MVRFEVAKVEFVALGVWVTVEKTRVAWWRPIIYTTYDALIQ